MINYINFNQERKHGCYMYQRNIKINPVCMIKDQSAMYGSSQLPLSLTILCMIVSKYEHIYIGLFKHLILLINIGVYIIFFLKILPLLSLANRQWVWGWKKWWEASVLSLSRRWRRLGCWCMIWMWWYIIVGSGRMNCLRVGCLRWRVKAKCLGFNRWWKNI